MHLNLCWFVLLSAAAIPSVASGQTGMTLTQANIPYGPYNDPAVAHSNELLDLYVPSGYATPRPVLIELHGGGWSKGMKGAFDIYIQNAAGYGMIEKAYQSGWAVATANYPLTAQAFLPNGLPNPSFPKNTFNVAALSTQRAVQWVRANAATYGLDADRVAIIGGSAGANLGLWAAISADAGNPFSPDPIAQQSSRADYVVDCWGPTYVDKAHLKSVPARPAQWEYFGTKNEAEFNLVPDALTLSASPAWLATRKSGLDIFDSTTASRNSKIPVLGVYEGNPFVTSSTAFTLPSLDPHGQVFGLLMKEAFDAYNLTQVPPVNWQDFSQYVAFSFSSDETAKNLTSNAVQSWLAARAALPVVRVLPVPGSYQQAVPFGWRVNFGSTTASQFLTDMANDPVHNYLYFGLWVSQPNPTAANPDLVLTYDQILNLGGVLTVSVTTNAIEIHLPPIPLAGVGWSSLSVGAMIVKSGSPNVVNIDTFTP